MPWNTKQSTNHHKFILSSFSVSLYVFLKFLFPSKIFCFLLHTHFFDICIIDSKGFQSIDAPVFSTYPHGTHKEIEDSIIHDRNYASFVNKTSVDKYQNHSKHILSALI